VTPRDVDLAVAEIQRAGAHSQVGAVVFTYPPYLLGHRSLAPLLQAAAERQLVVYMLADGAYTGSNRGYSAIGHPGTRLEHDLAPLGAAQPHLASLLVAGSLDRHPGLRLVLSGFGVGWLAPFIWRLEAEQRAGQTELSGLPRTVAETLTSGLRITTAGVELPPSPETLVTLLDTIPGGERLLVYGSGGRRPDLRARQFIASLSEPWRSNISSVNAGWPRRSRRTAAVA
jgi:predicted TIM-barrel fold metal-dependent hydrolase